jgi:hypothetical protein
VTGFPVEFVIDNTQQGSRSIDGTRVQSLSQGVWRAVSWLWPEADPRCGPGAYVLSSLTLALSQVRREPQLHRPSCIAFVFLALVR